jgi:AhpC/TSA family
MKRRVLLFSCLVGASLLLPAFSQVKVEVGKEAPDFELSDSAGRSYRLSSYRGKKAVVLEFFRSGDW